MKFCKDCAHYRTSFSKPIPRCAAPSIQIVDVVSGKTSLPFAFIERMPGSECGPDAVLFQQKTDSKATIYLKKIRAYFNS